LKRENPEVSAPNHGDDEAEEFVAASMPELDSDP